jgi:hypothetical protein
LELLKKMVTSVFASFVAFFGIGTFRQWANIPSSLEAYLHSTTGGLANLAEYSQKNLG